MARSHWKFKMKNNTLEMKIEPHVSKEDGKKILNKNRGRKTHKHDSHGIFIHSFSVSESEITMNSS